MKKSSIYLITILIFVAALVFVGFYSYKLMIEQGENILPINENQMDDITLVKDYLKKNINNLSPEPAVLGGTFYVTEIKCENVGECLVEYEDGHIAFVGMVKYMVYNGQVEITEFQIVGTDENTVDKTGYLTGSNDAWTLVYEEPGKPALTLGLVFDQQSNCLIDEIEQVCASENLTVGSRVNVQGIMTENQLIVRNLEVVEIGEAQTDSIVEICIDQCGDGVCNEIVCLGTNCPCAETSTSCPSDCLE